MPTPLPGTPADLQSRLDTLLNAKDDLLKTFFPDGDIGQEEQEVLDRISAKFEELQSRATAAATASAGKSISAPVGKGGKNAAEDVQTVQQLLNEQGSSLAVDGLIGPKTIGAINAYQKKTFGWSDGLVEPGKQTITALNGGGVPAAGDSDDQTTTGGGTDDHSTTTGSGGDDGQTGNIGGDTELPVPADVPGIEYAPVGTNEPKTTDKNPNDPTDMDRLTAEILDRLPASKNTVEAKDENGDVLSFVEFPFLFGQTISLGLKIGDKEGTLKAVFNEDGQIKEVDLEMPLIDGYGIVESPDGILCKGEVKPLSCEFKLKKLNGALGIELDLSTSGAIMVGLGLAHDKSWIGLGIEVELALVRNKKLTTELAFDMIETAISSGGSMIDLSNEFNLPSKFELKGSQSLILGGSANSKAAAIGLASKIVLRDYPEMILFYLDTDSIDYEVGPDLGRMIKDHLSATFPMLNLATKMIEMGGEVIEFIKDPEGYSDQKRKELDELWQQINEFPKDAHDLIRDELNKLKKFESEFGRQLDEWGGGIKDAIGDVASGYTDKFDEVTGRLLEQVEGVGGLVGGLADDLMNALDDVEDTAKSETKKALRRLDEARLKAETMASKIEKIAKDVAKGVAGVVVDEAMEMAREAREAAKDAARAAKEVAEVAQGVSETVRDAAQDAARLALQQAEAASDKAQEMAQTAKDAIEDAASGAIDTVEDAVGSVADAAESAVKEALKKAQAARQAAEDLAQAAEDAAESVVDNVVEEALERAKAARDAADAVARAAKEARDAAVDVADEVRETAENAVSEAIERAEAAHRTAEKMARAAQRAASDAQDAVEDTVDDMRESADSMMDEMRDSAESFLDDVMDTAGDMADAAQDAANEAQETAEGVADDIVEGAEDLVDEVDDAIDEVKERAERAARAAQEAAREAQEAVAGAADDALEGTADVLDDVADRLRNVFD